MDVRQALEQLEDTVISALHLPFSRMAVLDEEGLLDKLDELRLSLPQVIAESEAIVKRRDEIVAQAHRYAEEIVQAAEYKREQLLLESGIVHEAQQQAEEIRGIAQQERQDMLQNTMEEANRMKLEMENYSASVLQELEDRLTRSLDVIHDSLNHNNNHHQSH
ncbi:MAG: hypothetical protein AB4040_11130 [Synechococcus sp.]